MSEIDQARLLEWKTAIGRSESRQQRLETESLRRFALAIGSDPNVEKVQPPLAHWAFFQPLLEDGGIGQDGHPRRGDFLPPISLPRRMYASADIRFEAPLLIGEQAEQVRTIRDVSHKNGSSGDLVFLEVEALLSQDDVVRVRERQTYVYRESGAELPMPVDAGSVSEDELWEPGPVNLFRYSAATFNTHRIHYDLPYAQDVEGYPALVVHGPFTANKLAALAARDGVLSGFSFRARSPLFLGQPIRLQRVHDEVRALRCDGVTAMTAKASYR